MLTAAFKALVDRFGLKGETVGEVAAGAVIKHSRDYNLVRECVLASGLDPHTPGLDMQAFAHWLTDARPTWLTAVPTSFVAAQRLLAKI